MVRAQHERIPALYADQRLEDEGRNRIGHRYQSKDDPDRGSELCQPKTWIGCNGPCSAAAREKRVGAEAEHANLSDLPLDPAETSLLTLPPPQSPPLTPARTRPPPP